MLVLVTLNNMKFVIIWNSRFLLLSISITSKTVLLKKDNNRKFEEYIIFTFLFNKINIETKIDFIK